MDGYLYTIIVIAGINLMAALGLHIIWGMNGQFSIGHAAFMSIGAYVSVVLTTQFNVPFIISMLVAILVSGIAGYLVSLPTTRLRGDYLALVTIGFGEIVRVILLNMDITNGALGIAGIPQKTNIFYVSICLIIGLLIIMVLKKSWFGQALIAIRENQHAATVMGINVPKYKRWAFALGSAYAGCAGVLFAFYITFISPGDFALSKSIDILLFIIIGGLGSLRGVIIGTVIMTLLPEVLRFASDYRTIIYGVILVILMIYSPNGLIGIFNKLKARKVREKERVV